MKARLLVIGAIAVLGASMVVVPVAQAATIKNGVNCTKANATTKVGSKVYRCGKNPLVKPTRLTWTLQGCFKATSLLKSSIEDLEMWKDELTKAGPSGEKPLADFQATIADLEKTQADFCRRGA
jgi:hypothetical protein